jgi:hypothetical protein
MVKENSDLLKEKLIQEIKNLSIKVNRFNFVYRFFNNITIKTYLHRKEKTLLLKRILIEDNKIEIGFTEYTSYSFQDLNEFSLLDLQFIKIKLYERKTS